MHKILRKRHSPQTPTLRLFAIPAPAAPAARDSVNPSGRRPTLNTKQAGTLEQVRALEEGCKLAAPSEHSQPEVLNYLAGLRLIERHAHIARIRHEDLFELHRILADQAMDQGTAGRYRTIQVLVGRHIPPLPQYLSGLMMKTAGLVKQQCARAPPRPKLGNFALSL